MEIRQFFTEQTCSLANNKHMYFYMQIINPSLLHGDLAPNT